VSVAGFPIDPERRGSNDGAGSGEPPADDWNAQFTAIVSGISGSMRWQATEQDLDEAAATGSPVADDDADSTEPPRYPRAMDTLWTDAEPDSAESRRLRRELRRQERAEELAAHLQAQADFEAEMAADTEHFVPPPPPPLPRLRRRTVAALLLIAVGILLLAWPALVPAPLDLIVVVGLVLILGGGAILVAGMRRHRGAPGEGWDDGAEV